MTAKGLSDRLTATRAALSKSGNIPIMTMEDLELFRQQQMLLQATAGGGQGAGGGQSFGNGTINGGTTLSMLGAESGGFNYSMADTGQNLPFLLSSHNAALLEQDPVRRESTRQGAQTRGVHMSSECGEVTDERPSGRASDLVCVLLTIVQELFSGAGHMRHPSLAHIPPLNPISQLPDALPGVDPASVSSHIQ